MNKLAMLCAIVSLGGCQSIQFSTHRTTMAGSGAIFEKSQFVKQNVCDILHRFDLAKIENTNDGTACSIKYDASKVNQSNRNAMLYYVIAMSNQKCGVYKKGIVSKKSTFDFYSGSLATLFSGAGAILSHQPTAQAFSAAAGVVTGTRAEFNQAFFSNLATNVIISGIDQVRKEYLDKLETKLSKDLMEYPITAALGDAMEYHGLCSATEGLNKANDDITLVENIGVAKLNEFIKQSLKDPDDGAASPVVPSPAAGSPDGG